MHPICVFLEPFPIEETPGTRRVRTGRFVAGLPEVEVPSLSMLPHPAPALEAVLDRRVDKLGIEVADEAGRVAQTGTAAFVPAVSATYPSLVACIAVQRCFVDMSYMRLKGAEVGESDSRAESVRTVQFSGGFLRQGRKVHAVEVLSHPAGPVVAAVYLVLAVPEAEDAGPGVQKRPPVLV